MIDIRYRRIRFLKLFKYRAALHFLLIYVHTLLQRVIGIGNWQQLLFKMSNCLLFLYFQNTIHLEYKFLKAVCILMYILYSGYSDILSREFSNWTNWLRMVVACKSRQELLKTVLTTANCYHLTKWSNLMSPISWSK
jgi:hypothetical protein